MWQGGTNHTPEPKGFLEAGENVWDPAPEWLTNEADQATAVPDARLNEPSEPIQILFAIS
jgi:hypothetical protein